jgi:hypothetical protein
MVQLGKPLHGVGINDQLLKDWSTLEGGRGLTKSPARYPHDDQENYD